MAKEGEPTMMHFRVKEKSAVEPRYNQKDQTHDLNGKPLDYIANMTTTAIPNHRDTS